MNAPSMSLADLQAKIAKHAWEDPSFEAEFMADPKATFEKYTGSALPSELAIHAHHNTPTELHFVIPKKPADGELSDADLERVAGGDMIGTLILSIAVTVAVATSVAVGSTMEKPATEW